MSCSPTTGGHPQLVLVTRAWGAGATVVETRRCPLCGATVERAVAATMPRPTPGH